ncbi:hypothetical protein [Mycobacterium sp.]|uniref:hypothetical protein n=1 Tax=Mycobacterium sp. TaxID=1785 RepID=UPI0039C98596
MAPDRLRVRITDAVDLNNRRTSDGQREERDHDAGDDAANDLRHRGERREDHDEVDEQDRGGKAVDNGQAAGLRVADRKVADLSVWC